MEIPDIGESPKKSKNQSLLEDNKSFEKVDLSELDYLPCLIFPKQDLYIRKYNRLVKNTFDLTHDQIIEKSKEFFDIREIDESKGNLRKILILRKYQTQKKRRFCPLFFGKEKMVQIYQKSCL